MQIRGKEEFVQGAVLFALADTLAAHSIGGFKVGVGFALRKCRMCLATKEQLGTVHPTSDLLVASLVPVVNHHVPCDARKFLHLHM